MTRSSSYYQLPIRQDAKDVEVKAVIGQMTDFASYMWNMMSGVYGNFTSWCSHAMSHFYRS